MIVGGELSIPEGELIYRASRSGGPGGQHVNTSSTRIELWWDLAGSPSVSEEQRARLLAKLGRRIDSSGQLRIVSSASRSQFQNRREVTERFQAVLTQALAVQKKRKKTRPSKASKEQRLQGKKRQAAKKELRRRPIED